MDSREKIEEIAVPILSQFDAFIVETKILAVDKRKVVQLFVETDTGIKIDQCAEISRQLGTAVETSNIIEGSFILEVSSPDMRKPLKLLRQYKKNIGRLFKVRFQKDDDICETTGKLIAIEDELLTFNNIKNETYKISFDKIIESTEELPW